MKKVLLILFTGCGLVSCSPENEQVNKETAADTTDFATGIDSVKLKSGQDGTLVQAVEKDDRRELPADLKRLLDSLYTGWSLPSVETAALNASFMAPQGPYFVAGYFNPDEFKDYVVQIKEGKNISVLAFVNIGTKTEAFRIVRHQLLPEKRLSLSPVLLAPVSKGDTLALAGSKQPVVSESDGFSITQDQRTEIYFFRNGKFSSLAVPE